MDEGTKNTVSKLPLLTVRASPRDKEAWTARLREELTALIQVSIKFSLSHVYCISSYINRADNVNTSYICSSIVFHVMGTTHCVVLALNFAPVVRQTE